MSSILTNTSAMVALQTLKTTNANLEKTQGMIATGKKVESAKDNAAVWAISKVMESDVMGFKAISESLGLGESTVAVARNAAETVTDLLTEIKGKVVASQEENVDRAKIQTDIEALTDQIKSVVGAAQFNGLNLVKGFDDVSILSSLDRAADGTVATSDITVARQDLTLAEGTMGGVGDISANVTPSNLTVSATAIDGVGGVPDTIELGDNADYSTNDMTVDIGGTVITFAAGELTGDQDNAAGQIVSAINAAQIEGITASATGDVITFNSTRAFEETNITFTTAGTALVDNAATLEERAESLTFQGAATVAEGDGYQLGFGGSTYRYVASAGDTMQDVAKGLKMAIDGSGNGDVRTQVVQDPTTQEWSLKIDNDGADFTMVLVANQGGTATGGMAGLDGFDVTTEAGAEAALDNVETLIQRSIDSAASFGSVQGRIEIQADFVGKLMDSMKAGIGTLVDADMEAASARLQALQVQQQLGIQSLSIANQAPQSVLSLFR